MSQRASGYDRRPDEAYPTPSWVAAIFADWLKGEGVNVIWEPAAGEGVLASALAVEGIEVVATRDDFFWRTAMPEGVSVIATNPPYGPASRLAAEFIRHAFKLKAERLILLLKVDFDSGKTRTDLFRDQLTFAGKIVLLDRIKWFDGPRNPSENHALYIWDRSHCGEPWIRYAARDPVLRRPLAAASSSS
jgi:hypothetical protein